MNIKTIREFEGGSEPLWYLTKGHVDKAQFVDAVKRECERDVPVERVEHAYMRSIPTGEKGVSTLQIARPGRGAFAVTYIDLWTL